MKKLFSLILALLASTALWAYDFEVDGIYYGLLEGNNAKVTNGANKYSDTVNIPETVIYNGTTYSVKSIGQSAFAHCRALSSVTIPKSVTSIGDWAFSHCRSLSSVSLPNSIVNIGTSAFYACRSLSSVTIPNSVTWVGDEAFYDCSSLTSISIGNSIMSIGKDAFFNSAFYNENSNWKEGVLYIDKCLIKAQPEDISSTYIIQAGTRVIADQAFSACKALTSIEFPNSVMSIGSAAFAQCRSLSTLTIAKSVKSIGNSAFASCTSLQSLVIPEGVQTLGRNAFRNCNSLISVSLPHSLEFIDACVFYSISPWMEVEYNGTSQEWGKIQKGGNNIFPLEVMITCSDGLIKPLQK